MNSEIFGVSELGVGSEFSFTLTVPIGKEIAAEIVEVTPELTKEYFKNKKILVVDDTRINIKIMSMVLGYTEAEIFIAENGQEAVTVFKNNDIDLILMDCLMPIMDGFEATSAIRALEQESQHTIIFAVTACASEDIAERSVASGMDDIILKPFKFDELLSKLQQALMNSHKLNK